MKIKLIVIFGILLFAALIFPYKHKSNYTTNYSYGTEFGSSGRMIRIPFFKKIRIGFWKSFYDTGTIASLTYYDWGKIMISVEFYPDGQLKNSMQFNKDGFLIGKAFCFTEDGFNWWTGEGDGTGYELIEEIWYADPNTLIFHSKDGSIIVDRIEEYRNQFEERNSPEILPSNMPKSRREKTIEQ